MSRERGVDILLRLAIAVSFLYPPIAAYFDPVSWMSYFPSFINALPISGLVLLHSFGLIEIIIALWILFGKRPVIPSIAAALMLLLIVLFNFSQFDVLFRDVSILLAAIVLGVKHVPQVLTTDHKRI